MALQIKDKYKKTIVGFRKGGRVPLGERSEEDLTYLAWLAKNSGSRTLLDYFEGELPSEEELKGALKDQELAKGPKAKSTAAGSEAASAKAASGTASSVSNVGATGGSAANASGSTT